MSVRQLKVGTEQNFVYLLVDEPTGEAMVIDSGWEIDPILSVASHEGLEVKYAAVTHRHSDHSSTVWQLAQALDAKVVAYRDSPVTHDISVDEGDELWVGRSKVTVLHTPGHTEDSICLYDSADLFTGDTLFIGNCGRTDLFGGSSRKMFRSLRRILELPPATIIYPGHDYGDAPFRELSEEARLNPTLSAKTYAQFLAVP